MKTMKKALEIFSTILVSIAALLFLWTQVEDRWLRAEPSRARRAEPSPLPQDIEGLRIEASRIRYSKGTGDIALVEFTDYECPYCGRHARETSPKIHHKWVASGAVRHILFNFPLESIHPNARKAGEAAECAARQGRFWEMHERLFADPNALAQNLTQSADALGLDGATFNRCMEGEAADVISADLAEGRRLGVATTPTFFVGIVQRDGSIQLAKRVSGARSFEVFQSLIDSVTTAKGKTN
jgi:protein-disulfide isomerase